MNGLDRLRAMTPNLMCGSILIRGMTERAGVRFAFLSDARLAVCLRTEEEVPLEFNGVRTEKRETVEPSLREWIALPPIRSRPMSVGDLREWAGYDIYESCSACEGAPLRCGRCSGKGTENCSCPCGLKSHDDPCPRCKGDKAFSEKDACGECEGSGNEVGRSYIRWGDAIFNGNLLALALSFCEPEAGAVGLIQIKTGRALRVEAHDARWIVMLMEVLSGEPAPDIQRELSEVAP